MKSINIEEEMRRIGDHEKRTYDDCDTDKNELSYWYPKIKGLNGKGVIVPKTVIIPVTLEWFRWLRSDSYSNEKVQEFNEYVIEELEKTDFEIGSEAFMKTGLFSDKFTFRNPHIKKEDYNKLGDKFLNIFYSSMCVGCKSSKNIVVREFIRTELDRPCIYSGMKLNTEFRVFYDFDKKEVVKVANYWDYNTMMKVLKDGTIETPNGTLERKDRTNFKSASVELLKSFNDNSQTVKELTEKLMVDVDLEGVWSVDFMWTGKDFVLIDMALAKNSAYYKD